VGATEPPAEVLLLRATLRQRTHDFDAALLDLAVLLQRNPRDGQARLTRATILQVQGNYDAAASRMRGASPSRTRTGLGGLWLRAGQRHGRFARELRRAPCPARQAARSQTRGARAWVSVHARRDGGARRPDDAAEAHFREALAIDPSDHYLLNAYADWLLDHGARHRS
jgi:Tfp pilus assembly protein PilF